MGALGLYGLLTLKPSATQAKSEGADGLAKLNHALQHKKGKRTSPTKHKPTSGYSWAVCAISTQGMEIKDTP
jgi:hypothetical protein